MILVACGLGREASIASGEGVTTVVGGGSRAALEERLAGLNAGRFSAVLSFGLAGALGPRLRAGDVLVPVSCKHQDGDVAVASVLSRAIVSRLPDDGLCRSVLPNEPLTLVGVDVPAVTRADKSKLARRFGAAAVDMESHVAGIWAERNGLPFAILRVVSDGSDRDLPPLVSAAMKSDGSIDIGAVVASLVKRPSQIPALVATARDAAVAFRSLRRVRRLLGPRFGLDL